MNGICGSSILPVSSDFDPNELDRTDIRAHYQLDQQFGDNSFDRKQDESRLPKIYPEQLVLHSHGEHYAKFGVLLEFGTEVRMINSIDIRSLLIYTELL
ncbi:hypothetical protein NC652_028532 [Populus alba x Populus x berolinensis]|nr:hypothetical protein NC652_028532 [Populus alba x Populus x berolinensis]